ncbi:MAG: hypothetical protein JSS00_05255 [Proteobacteria bacterium]|nr:hypothetical protein [Pseudomonadota bacterium]
MLSESIAAELRQLEARSLTILAEFKSAFESRADIRARAEILRRAHSNSFFGDHALTYFRDFEAPLHGFDVEWGHLDGFHGKHNSDWIVYGLDDLLAFVYRDSSFEALDEDNRKLDLAAIELRDRALDLFSLVEEGATGSVSKIAADIRQSILSAWEDTSAQSYVSRAIKSAPRMTRDSSNISQGMRTPVHVAVLAQLHFLKETADALLLVANSARRVLLGSKLIK